MSDTIELTQDEALTAEARAVLEGAGCVGIRIQGGGDAWWVWALLASSDGVLHEACAFSARNPATPNDPVYLAGSLLTTLRKNVWAHERGMGLVDAPQSEPEPAPLMEGADILPPEAPQEPDMAQPININVAPVFNVTGGNATNTSDAERAAIAEVEQMFDSAPEPQDTPQDETHGETGADAAGGAQAPPADDPEQLEPGGDGLPEVDRAGDWSSAEGAGAGQDELITDAEFWAEELNHDPQPLDDANLADLPLIEGGNLSDEPEPEPEAQSGPIAYAASDLDALIREKLGRVSQIARELKAALQEGWTLEEFASLQNLIVRIDRKEAPDDEPARARFQAISERSQAMSRVDGHRDALEAALEDIGKSRDYAAAVEFDPEREWPYFG